MSVSFGRNKYVPASSFKSGDTAAGGPRYTDLGGTSMSNQNQALRTALVSVQRRVKELEASLTSSEDEKRRLQHEIGVAKGEVARAKTDLDIAREDRCAVERSKQMALDNLQREGAHMQRDLADLLAEKANYQTQIRNLDHDRCALSVQLDTMKQDLEACHAVRACTEANLQAAQSRADKAEHELARIHRDGVEHNLQVVKLQAENQQLRDRMRTMETERNTTKNDVLHRQAALENVTRQVSEQAVTINALQSQVQCLTQQKAQLQGQLDVERVSTKQAADVSANMEKMQEALQKQNAVQREYFETKSAQVERDYQGQLEMATQQLQAMTERLNAVQAEARLLQTRLGEAEAQRQHADRLVQDGQGDARSLQCEVLRLQDALGNKEAEKAKLESTINSMMVLNEDLHRQVHKTVDALQTPPRRTRKCRQAPNTASPTIGSRRSKPFKFAEVHHLAQSIRARSLSPTPSCADATAVAAAVKVREQGALRSHLTRQSKSSTHTASAGASQHSVSSRLARAAASPLMKTAEKVCKHELKAARRNEAMIATLESEYCDMYNKYQRVSAIFKNEGGKSSKRSAQLQKDIVQLMGDLSVKAQQLMCLRKAT